MWVCVLTGRQRARSGNRATLPTASLASLALHGPRKQNREVLGETPSQEQSPYLSSARARGLARAALPLAEGARRRTWLLTKREGQSWEAEGPQD